MSRRSQTKATDHLSAAILHLEEQPSTTIEEDQTETDGPGGPS
jgi:hypothetical protein